MQKSASALVLAALLAACSSGAVATPRPSPPAHAAIPPRPSPTVAVQLGPGGLTLDEEVGAVIMVGFKGPATEAVLADWRQRQFGGLLVVNLNQNASTPAEMSALLGQFRAADRHRLLAATDQEGGGICIALSSVPCSPMPVGQAASAEMAAAIHAVGFDLDLGPVSDVCNGPSSVMWGRCYGTDPAAVSAAVGAAVDGIHEGHMLAAAKHFPGHGPTTVSSETQLPTILETLPTIQAREWPPFEAAATHGADFVLLGHLFYPALDSARSADLSPVTVDKLRSVVGFKGAILSDDMEMGAITSSTPAREAAVEYLLAGGDMVMIAHDLDVADATYDAVRNAVLSGRVPRSRLDEAVASLQALPMR